MPLHNLKNSSMGRKPFQFSSNESSLFALSGIKERFSADVCSLYLFESDYQLLRLEATDGLLQSAVGHTCLRPGEGLAGLVFDHQETFCTPIAPEHPKFRYFPNIGEETFQSFIGTPMMQGKEAIGVLILQYLQARDHSLKEMEDLEEAAHELGMELDLVIG